MNTIEKRQIIQTFLNSEYSFAILSEQEKNESLKYLDSLPSLKDTSVYFFYSKYDFGNIDAGEPSENSSVSFYEMCYVHEIAESKQFINEVWGVPDNFIPVTNTEGECCVVFDPSTNHTCYYILGTGPDIEKASKKVWNSFEDYLMDYLNVK